jgi:hypothetical protein
MHSKSLQSISDLAALLLLHLCGKFSNFLIEIEYRLISKKGEGTFSEVLKA